MPEDGGVVVRQDQTRPDAADAGALPSVPYVRKVIRLPPLPRQAKLAQVFIGDEKSPFPWTPPKARKRSRAEARALAERVASEAHSGGDFAALAKRYSEWPLASNNGGALGIVTQGFSGQLPIFPDSVFALKPGEVSEAYQSEVGFHVFKSLPVMHLAHILIRVADGKGSSPPRTQSEARTLAGAIAADLKAGKPFTDEAFEFSDDLSSAGRGGDLGVIDDRGGGLSPAQRMVIANLKVGEVSAPLETPAGIEILERVE